MNLSILVPIYNFDVREFISELNNQAIHSGIEYEILCFDDGSSMEFKLINRSIAKITGVTYEELEKNIGRSKIRNLLAHRSKFENLLFADCDSKIISVDYLKNIMENHTPGTVIFGGRCYSENPPKSPSEKLRWLYGIKRECFPVEIRNKNPYKYFMTNNFFISRKLFLSIRMNENLSGYGHEDTVFANELKINKIGIRHINNPLCHLGLEDAEDFLEKTEQGISNLSYMINTNKAGSDVKIIKYYRLFKKTGVIFFIKMISNIFDKAIRKNLLSENPYLRFFDFFKLALLIKKMEKN